MQPEVLCIDSGTSSLKGAVIDSRGNLISNCRVYCLSDCASRYEGLKKLISSLNGTASISAVAVSGNGPSLFPIKADFTFGTPLFWYENKTAAIKNSCSMYIPLKKWFQENYPKDYNKTEYFLTSDGLINYFLTDKISAAVYSSAFMPYFWEQNTEKMPGIIFTGNQIGGITDKAASLLGLKAGIPVFAGSSDFLMAILGTATLAPGLICDRAGTSEGLNYCCEEKKSFVDNRTMPHIIPGLWNISSLLPTSGIVFSWVQELLAKENRTLENYWQYAHNIIASGKKLNCFPWNKNAASLSFSQEDIVKFAKFHSPEELVITASYSVAMALAQIIEDFESKGLKVNDLRVSGGAQCNKWWLKIKEMVIERKILIPRISDGELAGCACAALAGLGIYSSLKQASENVVRF